LKSNEVYRIYTIVYGFLICLVKKYL